MFDSDIKTVDLKFKNENERDKGKYWACSQNMSCRVEGGMGGL